MTVFSGERATGRMGNRWAWCLTAFMLAVAPVAHAQSLGDVARQEEARRKTSKAAGKTYTNDSLQPAPSGASTPQGPSATSAQAPAAASFPTPGTGPTQQASTPSSPGPQAAPAQAPPRDEKYWRQRIEDARAAMARTQVLQEAMQSRINALTNDFEARDDPAQRRAIAADRQRALAESDRLKKELLDQQKAMTDIQDEARRAGVPAGWVR